METRTKEIGARIAGARKAAGLTQAALGQALGLDATIISKIENGHRRADIFELTLIADRTDSTLRDLLGSKTERSVLAAAARLGELSSAGAEPAVRRARQILELDALADELDLPESAHPTRPIQPPTDGSDARQGADLAAALRDRFRLGQAGIPDLVGLCERAFGLDVAVEPLGEAPSGLMVNYADEVALVLLNADDSSGRQLFTLAHELAHHLFGDPVEVFIEGGDGLEGDARMERRADEFAVELLMPEDGLRSILAGGPVDVAAIVDMLLCFGVSREALLNRLKDLKLVSLREKQRWEVGTVRSLFVTAGRASDYGSWRTGLGPRRPPIRIERRLLRAYSAGRIGIGPLATLAGQAEDDLREALQVDGIVPDLPQPEYAIDAI